MTATMRPTEITFSWWQDTCSVYVGGVFTGRLRMNYRQRLAWEAMMAAAENGREDTP